VLLDGIGEVLRKAVTIIRELVEISTLWRRFLDEDMSIMSI